MTKDDEEKGTHVNVILDKDSNNILTSSARHNDRSKRREAGKRLAHHLQLFGENWQTELDAPES